jgi:hypothetical protein
LEVAVGVVAGFGGEGNEVCSEGGPGGFGGEGGDVLVDVVEVGDNLRSDELFGGDVEGVGVALDGVVQAGGGAVGVAVADGLEVEVIGVPAKSDLTERMIGISASQLRAIPEVIGLAYNIARSPAVQAAIRGGFIKSLVELVKFSV